MFIHLRYNVKIDIEICFPFFLRIQMVYFAWKMQHDVAAEVNPQIRLNGDLDFEISNFKAHVNFTI